MRFAVLRSNCYDHDFFGFTSLANTQCFLDRNLVERIDAELHAVGNHATAVGLYANSDVVIDDALDGDEYAHHEEFIEIGVIAGYAG